MPRSLKLTAAADYRRGCRVELANRRAQSVCMSSTRAVAVLELEEASTVVSSVTVLGMTLTSSFNSCLFIRCAA